MIDIIGLELGSLENELGNYILDLYFCKIVIVLIERIIGYYGY